MIGNTAASTNSRVLKILSSNDMWVQAENLMKSGNIASALFVYEKLSLTGGSFNRAEAFYKIAYCYYLLDNPVQVQEYLGKAVELNPGHSKAVSGKMDSFYKEGKFESALEVLERYITAGGIDENLLNNHLFFKKMCFSNLHLLPTARKIFNKTKAEVISCADIIDVSKFQEDFNPKKMDEYLAVHGMEKYFTFLRHSFRTELINKNFEDISLDNFSKKYIKLDDSLSLAKSYFGIGNCGVMLFKALFELINAGLDCYCSQFFLYSEFSQTVNHTFLILHQDESIMEIKKLEDFADLSDDMILFDPFCNVLGPANQLKTLIGHFLEGFSIYSDCAIKQNGMQLEKNDLLPLIEKDAKEIFSYVKENGKGFFKYENLYKFEADCFELTEVAFQVAHQNLLAVGGTNPDAKVKGIREALQHYNYTAAFRKACAYGQFEIAAKILEIASGAQAMLSCSETDIKYVKENNPAIHARLLSLKERVKFDINAVADTHKNTALDWANALPDSTKKTELIASLNKAGAKSHRETAPE